MNNNKIMRSAVITGVKKVEIQTFDIPKCLDGYILVKIDACGICTWEQRVFQGIHKINYPIIAGHEIAGHIVEIGKGIDSGEFSVGDKVVVGMSGPCRDCYACKTGNEQNCPSFSATRLLAGQPYIGAGGFSEYMVVRPQNVFKYYDVTPAEACMTEPVSCVLHSVETADPQFGQVVMIIGAGIMGLLHTLLCVRRGTCVVITDYNDERLALAKKLGASYTLNPNNTNVADEIKNITHGFGAEIVFDTTPIASTVEDAFNYIGKMGKIMVYSGIYPNKPIQINTHRIHSDAIQLMGSVNSNDRDFMRATSLISHHIVDLKPFISGKYPVEQAEAALVSSCSGTTFRNIITFD